MSNLNKVMLIGRLTRDPEMRYTQAGIPVLNMDIAVNKGKDKEADFFKVTAWEQLAEICSKYCQKGKLVYVEGRLQINTYEKDVNGAMTKFKDPVVVAKDVKFLSPRDQPQQQNDDGNSGYQQDVPPPPRMHQQTPVPQRPPQQQRVPQGQPQRPPAQQGYYPSPDEDDVPF